MSHRTDPAVRFWSKVDKTDTCWLWTGYRIPKGYPVFTVNGRKGYRAHRWAYETFVGPIPAGLVLDHLCRVRHCVNPAHLEPVTNRENVLRGIGITAQHATKTHCPQGHPYDEANTYIIRGGRRRCRACNNADRSRRYWAQRPAPVSGLVKP